MVLMREIDETRDTSSKMKTTSNPMIMILTFRLPICHGIRSDIRHRDVLPLQIFPFALSRKPFSHMQ